MTAVSQEAQEARFGFGDNWSKYFRLVDETAVQRAVESLKRMLEVDSLEGKSFIDIGSGSGLFSLAARKLGANVLSFDYDPMSVATTKRMRDAHHPNDQDWRIEQGSVLDTQYLATL